jgi:hypothetical protein
LPTVAPGAPDGGAFTWQSACFAELLVDDGGSCFDESGAPASARCASGLCEPLGARGLCTVDCALSPCTPDSACATFNQSLQRRCLVRCDATHACTDPLLACETVGPGAFGFSVPSSETPGTAYCAPKRCAAPADCAPAGGCVAGFCQRG